MVHDGTIYGKFCHLSHILGGQKFTNSFMFIIPGWLIRTALPTHTVEAPWATANTADLARAPTAGFILEPDFLYGHRYPAWWWPWPKKEAIQLPNPGVPRYPRFAMFNPQPQNPPIPRHRKKWSLHDPSKTTSKQGLKLRPVWVPFLCMLFFSDSDSDDETWKVLIILDA